MAIKDNLNELMERKMDRGEFLRMAAITVAGVIGIARFIGVLDHTTSATKQNRSGYGGGAYGGTEKVASYLKKLQ